MLIYAVLHMTISAEHAFFFINFVAAGVFLILWCILCTSLLVQSAKETIRRKRTILFVLSINACVALFLMPLAAISLLLLEHINATMSAHPEKQCAGLDFYRSAVIAIGQRETRDEINVDGLKTLSEGYVFRDFFVRHGVAIVYDTVPSSRRRECSYNSGELHGADTTWRRDGSILIGHWEMGTRVGIWRLLGKDGRVIKEDDYGMSR
jgi:hypothetical protein